MAEKTVRGQFLWHELMTPDTAGAHAFYSRALGWKSHSWEQDPSYSMFVASRGPLGGSVALPTGTPHWLHYIGTEDIDATVQQATGLGASVRTEVTTIPGGGRYAVLADPQGAVFGLYASEATQPGNDVPRRGEFSWHELATTDCQAAFEFYAALFGWEKAVEHDMGAMGVYLIFSRDGTQLGGMFNKPPQMKGDPAWLGYVRVKDVRQTVGKVKSARGTLINGPMEVPGGDWIAQFIDPYGAMFAVHTVAADMKAAAPAAASATSAAAEPVEPAEPAAAKQPAKKPARKAAAARKSTKKKAAKKAAKKATKQAVKKAPKKAAARRKTGSKKKTAAKKKSAARSAKRPARTAARKKSGKKAVAGKKRSAGRTKTTSKKKGARRPRKAK